MIRKTLMYFAGVALLLAGVVGILYVTNPAPRAPRVELASLQDSPRPYVVKVHAQWCPVCMMTKDMWDQVQQAYAGKVNLVVFDVTGTTTEQASRAEAQRLGLGDFFDENSGSTGTVYVLNGRTKAVVTSIHGSRNFGDYSSAIDGALLTKN